LIRITSGLASVTVIALAPLVIRLVAPKETNWEQLSAISQIYGSCLSAVALVGVAASLIYQARQTAMASEDTSRASHRELIMMALEDPSLLPCWEPSSVPLTALEMKQIFFTNLIVTNWLANYRMNRLNDEAMRAIFAKHFRGEIARKQWQISAADGAQAVNEAIGEPRRLAFFKLGNEAYAKAVSEGPPISASAYFSTVP
jgi:hypothetical protein